MYLSGCCVYLVALRHRVLYARGWRHVVGHSLVHRRRWSQDPVLEALGASWEPALLCRKARVLIIQTPLHSELILGGGHEDLQAAQTKTTHNNLGSGQSLICQSIPCGQLQNNTVITVKNSQVSSETKKTGHVKRVHSGTVFYPTQSLVNQT